MPTLQTLDLTLKVTSKDLMNNGRLLDPVVQFTKSSRERERNKTVIKQAPPPKKVTLESFLGIPVIANKTVLLEGIDEISSKLVRVLLSSNAELLSNF